MKGFSIKGIFVASVFVVIADVIGATGLHVVIGKGQPAAVLFVSTPFLLGSVVLGTLTTVMGGYVAARIATTRHYCNAAVVGGLGFVAGIFTAKFYLLWFNLAVFSQSFRRLCWAGTSRNCRVEATTDKSQ